MSVCVRVCLSVCVWVCVCVRLSVLVRLYLCVSVCAIPSTHPLKEQQLARHSRKFRFCEGNSDHMEFTPQGGTHLHVNAVRGPFKQSLFSCTLTHCAFSLRTNMPYPDAAFTASTARETRACTEYRPMWPNGRGISAYPQSHPTTEITKMNDPPPSAPEHCNNACPSCPLTETPYPLSKQISRNSQTSHRQFLPR
jgi:hypothetical protein